MTHRSWRIWVIAFWVSLLAGSCFEQTASPASVGAGPDGARAEAPRPVQMGESLGSPSFKSTPDRPVGWRGDWTGRFPGATPPIEWSRRARGLTSEIRYQAAKPVGEPGADSFLLEY